MTAPTEVKAVRLQAAVPSSLLSKEPDNDRGLDFDQDFDQALLKHRGGRKASREITSVVT